MCHSNITCYCVKENRGDYYENLLELTRKAMWIGELCEKPGFYEFIDSPLRDGDLFEKQEYFMA